MSDPKKSVKKISNRSPVDPMNALDSTQDDAQDATQDHSAHTITQFPQKITPPNPILLDTQSKDLLTPHTYFNQASSHSKNSVDSIVTLDSPSHQLTQSMSSHSTHASHKNNWKDMIGQMIGGCRLDQVLGAGGMGVVFKAHHINLDISVAVKCLTPKEDAVSQDMKERFSREARAAARLKHDNIVAVYNAGISSGIYYIVMELVEGESLDQKIKRKGQLGLEESLGHCLDICEALSYAEKQQIVHRDLKPGNILINHDGRAKLADLGLIKWNLDQDRETLTVQGMAMGTPHYMAPEQAIDAYSVDHRADLYALGCTLYHMLAGKPPFQNQDLYELLNLQVTADRPNLAQNNPNIPTEISDLIATLMSVDPHQRHNSAAVVIHQILSIFDSSSTLKEPLILPSQYRHSYQRYERFALKTAQKKINYLTRGIALLLMIALASVWYLWNQNQKIDSHSTLVSTPVSTPVSTKNLMNVSKAYNDYSKARIYRQNTEWLQAAQSYKKAIINGYLFIDVIKDMLLMLKYLSQEDLSEEYLNELYILFPKSIALKFIQATRAKGLKSIKLLQKVIEDNPKFLPAYLEYALVLETPEVQKHMHILERLGKSVNMVNKAIEVMEVTNIESQKLYYNILNMQPLKERFRYLIVQHEQRTKTVKNPLYISYSYQTNQDKCLFVVMIAGQLYQSIKKLGYRFNAKEDWEYATVTHQRQQHILRIYIPCHFNGSLDFIVVDKDAYEFFIKKEFNVPQLFMQDLESYLSNSTWYKSEPFTKITAVDIYQLNQVILTLNLVFFYKPFLELIRIKLLTLEGNKVSDTIVYKDQMKGFLTVLIPKELHEKRTQLVLEFTLTLANKKKIMAKITLKEIFNTPK
jgi:serine/threonine protein kinase